MPILQIEARLQSSHLRHQYGIFGGKSQTSFTRNATRTGSEERRLFSQPTYVNAMGGIKSANCNDLAQQIWQWCREREIWLRACHIPGSTNVDADTESRTTNSSTEWSLHSDVFADINKMWGPFHVDVFASRLNFKVSTYASWKPDPGAKYVNAFYMSWKEHYFCAFPPFSVIAACLQKIDQDQAPGVLLVPIWQTQPWFTTLLHLLVDYPPVFHS